MTAVQGPVTTAVDASGTTQTTKRRVQKSYEDILGRNFKTEQWDLDGAGMPTVGGAYSTTKATFNGRDQATEIIQYAGTEDSGHDHQTMTATFDGHGRLSTKHIPQQDTGTSGHTTYSYNADDSISTVTDARTAVTTYTYENSGGTLKRPVVTGISWSAGSSGATVPTSVTYTYDNAGNRTAMTDGLGSVAYNYNELSQMTDETRTFDDTISNAPISSHGFKLEYTYNLSGELASLKDPYGQQTNYAYDKIGRLSAVTDSSSFAGISTYASSPGYRAWGALKTLTYGNGDVQTTTFDSRLRPAVSELHKSDSTSLMHKAYDYYADGSSKTIVDSVDARFDRLNTYDFAGRVAEGKTGADARSETPTDRSTQIPYHQNIYV